MNSLSQWLQLMLAEIARKQEDLESARAETERRAREQAQVQVQQATTAQVRSSRR
jgi:hypothetical protein